MNGTRLRIDHYDFGPAVFDQLRDNTFARDLWPVVYILSNGETREAYIGETTDTFARMAAHARHDAKSRLTSVRLITSETFHKSATLDIESNLIRYVAADGQFSLLNGNLGIAYHNYYQKSEVYWQIFRDLWDRLRAEGLAKHSLEHIDNSDLFKYSPYKSLSREQSDSLVAMLQALAGEKTRHVVVEGGAGTGKTILAIFLCKLLSGRLDDMSFRDFGDREQEILDLLKIITAGSVQLKIALVVPMASFRATLKKAFKNIKGLSASMVTGPSDIVRERYDIIVVDESHRLRRRVNLGTYFGAFDKACATLGLDPATASELDWVSMQADKTLLFYDANQSIKPSDVPAGKFEHTKALPSTVVQKLTTQFRVKGGSAYVDFVDKLLNGRLAESSAPYSFRDYEVILFEEPEEMVTAIQSRNEKAGLARMIAGYAWEWKSNKDATAWDIELGEVKLRWNTSSIDWIHSESAAQEVGCIHTTQGYDLNYAAIIMGPEIYWDETLQQIKIRPEKYCDRNGKQSVKDIDELRAYILNIYKTIMLRGIRGTFLYICDDALREYVSRFVPVQRRQTIHEATHDVQELIPFVDAVPLYNLQVAAGSFSDVQAAAVERWVSIPRRISIDRDLFACVVVGESMNRIIPAGSVCLFRRYRGGSRQGRIVLAELTDYTDADFGSRYTVKEYESTKYTDEEGWHHTSIRLLPRSTNPGYLPVELHENDDSHCQIIAYFECVLSVMG
jgi:DUF2075 family protein/predicted GIY-YIG superfamily endonuclease